MNAHGETDTSLQVNIQRGVHTRTASTHPVKSGRVKEEIQDGPKTSPILLVNELSGDPEWPLESGIHQKPLGNQSRW